MAQKCIVVVEVMNKSNMALYFAEVGNLNGSDADNCVLMWLGRQVAARVICLNSQIGQTKLFFYYFLNYEHYWPPSWIF